MPDGALQLLVIAMPRDVSASGQIRGRDPQLIMLWEKR